MCLCFRKVLIILQIFFFAFSRGLGKGTMGEKIRLGKDNGIRFNRIGHWMCNYKCVLINKYIYLVLNLNIQWEIELF